MSWHFLLEQEEAYWEGSSLVGASDALSRLIPMRAECCSQGSEMDCSPDSRSGMTSQPLMDCHGEDISTSSANEIRDAYGAGCEEQWEPLSVGEECSPTERAGWWEIEPSVGRVAHGVASRVDRLSALGNGQVPICAALAWRILSGVA